jgi:phosphoribosylanthranilate isomerase
MTDVGVKICGVCRAEDARLAASAGAAWIGVILAPGRTRSQTVEQAGVIFDAAAAPRDAASPRRVGVFVDAQTDVVADAVRVLGLDAVQLHGDESLELVRSIRGAVACEVWKAVRVRSAADVTRAARTYASVVDALLLDGWSADAHGGAGVTFDWDAVAGTIVDGTGHGLRLIVAGGLTPDNVEDAIRLLHPAAVDVSSGVEAAPGRKSPGKIHAFIAAARGARMER